MWITNIRVQVVDTHPYGLLRLAVVYFEFHASSQGINPAMENHGGGAVTELSNYVGDHVPHTFFFRNDRLFVNPDFAMKIDFSFYQGLEPSAN